MSSSNGGGPSNDPGTIRPCGPDIPSGVAGISVGTIRAPGTDIPSGVAQKPGDTIHAQSRTIPSGFAGQPAATHFTPGDTVLINLNSYGFEKVIAKSTGEAEIFLLSSSTGHCVFKLYYPNFQPNDDVLRQLKRLRHPDIINVLDYGYFGDRFFEIMEHADGGTLEQYLPVRDMDRLKLIVAETVNAFAFCHDNGIVHRDIKPGNLYYRNADGTDLVVGDFGISSALDAGVSRHLTSQSLTVGYAAPEMYGIGGKVYVGREVDYYALGITLIHLWQGSSPFAGLTIHAIASLTTSASIRIPDDLPKEFKTLVLGLITTDFTRRWGYDEVKRWLRGEDVPVHFVANAPSRPVFHFDANLDARSTPELATLMKRCPDRGKKQLYSGKASAWVNLFDTALAADLDRVIELEYAKDQAAGLQKAIYLLDPDEPFLSLSGDPCRTPKELAAALDKGFSLYEQQLADPSHAFYLFLEAHETGAEASTFRTYYKTFSKKRALNAIILALSEKSSVSIDGVEVSAPEALLRFRDQQVVVKELKDRDSRLSVWMDTHADATVKQQLEDWRALEVCDSSTLSFVSTNGDGVPKLSVGPASFSYVDVKRRSNTTGRFEIRNDGGGHLSGSITSDKPWLVVDQSTLDEANRVQSISFTASTAAVPYGMTDRATIGIRTNVGSAAVTVDLRVEDGARAIVRFRNLATGAGALLGALIGAGAYVASERFGLPDSTLTVGLIGIVGAALFAWWRRRRLGVLATDSWSPVAVLVAGIVALTVLMKGWPTGACIASWGWLLMTGAFIFSPYALQFHQGGYKLEALRSPRPGGPNPWSATVSASGAVRPIATGTAVLSVVGGASGALTGAAVGLPVGIVGGVLVWIPTALVFWIASFFVNWETGNVADRVSMYAALALWLACPIAGGLLGAGLIRTAERGSRLMIAGAMAAVAAGVLYVAWIKQDYVIKQFRDLSTAFEWNKAWDCGDGTSLSVTAGNDEHCSVRLDSTGTLYFKGKPMKPAIALPTSSGVSVTPETVAVWLDKPDNGRYVVVDGSSQTKSARYVADTQTHTLSKVTSDETEVGRRTWWSPQGDALAFISLLQPRAYLTAVWLPEMRRSRIEIPAEYQLAEATWVDDDTFRLAGCPPGGCRSAADRKVWTLVTPATADGSKSTAPTKKAIAPSPITSQVSQLSPVAAEGIEAPSVRVGDQWVTEVVDHQDAALNYRAERTVTDVGPDRIFTSVRTLGKDYTRVVEYTGEWALVATHLRSGATTSYSPALPYLSFPLQPGRSWQGRVVETDAEGKQRVHDVRAQMGSWETVQVPAGTFESLKIVLTDDISKDGVVVQQGQDVSWYAPDVRRTVKTEESSFDPATGERRRRTISLVEYSVGGRDGAVSGSGHRSPAMTESSMDLTPLFAGMENSCSPPEEFQALLKSLGYTEKQANGRHIWKMGAPAIPERYRPAFGALAMSDKGGYTEFTLPVSGTYYGLPVTQLRMGEGNENGISFHAIRIEAPAEEVARVLRGKLNRTQRLLYESEGPPIEARILAEDGASLLECNFSD